MTTITKKYSEKEIYALKKRLQNSILKESQPNYTYYQIKTKECTITAYTSGKVVFQGKDLSWMEDHPSKKIDNQFPQAGSDEVGTGDYFGPVVVSASIIHEKDVETLKKLGIQDSKQINDEKIRKLAIEIKKICPHTILIVPPKKYNQIHQSHNMVDIKCLLHNQAYLNLKNKGYPLPEFKIIDQFVQEKSYYRYLKNKEEVIHNIHFETKAENKYLSVACASILARNAFLEYWDQMEEKYNFSFVKGASNKVDLCAKKFVNQFGTKELEQVAKLHFANTKKITNL